MLFILASFFVFQSSIIPISASPIIFGQEHHTGISEIYTYDGIETSACVKTDLTRGLSRVLSIKGVRPDHEVLVGVTSVAAKTGANLTKFQLKSISSLESQIAKHQTKLAEYIKSYEV